MKGVHIIENYNYIIISFLCNFKSLSNNEYYSFKKIKEKGKNEKIYTPKLSSLQVKKLYFKLNFLFIRKSELFYE